MPALFPAGTFKKALQEQISVVFLFLFEVDGPKLRVLVVIYEIVLLIAELFDRQVILFASDHVVAVEITVWSLNSVYFAAENVLNQKSRDGALTQSLVLVAPFALHSRCAGRFTPYTL